LRADHATVELVVGLRRSVLDERWTARWPWRSAVSAKSCGRARIRQSEGPAGLVAGRW